MRLVLPSLIVLVGPSGAGKSTWAAEHFDPNTIVSSDALRAAVGLDAFDQRASRDAFDILDEIVLRRLGRRLTTVIDTVGLNQDNRLRWVEFAKDRNLPVYAVVFDTPPKLCRARNRSRIRPVPARALTAQIASYAETRPQLRTEGFDGVFAADEPITLANHAFDEAPLYASRQKEAPMRIEFGLQLAAFNWSDGSAGTRKQLASIAQAAERVGFRSMWVMDHFIQIPQVGREWDDILEAYTTLGYLAGITEDIRLGTMVTGVAYRNPALLGKMIATLDVLSGGRAIAGLGAGWYEREVKAYGFDELTLGERFDRLEDTLQILPLMWGPGSPSYDGTSASVPEAISYPRPLQEHIPILVGGGGEKRTLRLVAQYADMCNLMGDAATVKHKLEVLAKHCEAVGRDMSEISVTHLAPALTGIDSGDAMSRAAEMAPPSLSAEQFAAQINAGSVEDQIGRYRELAEAGVQSAIVGPVDLTLDGPAALERFAPVIEAFSV